MDNDLTSQIYTEYFNIIHLEHELFNTILNRQANINDNLHRMLLNYQNYILYPSTASNRRRNANNNNIRPLITPIRTSRTVRNPMRRRPRISIREPPVAGRYYTRTNNDWPSFTSTFANLRHRPLSSTNSAVSINTLVAETTNFVWHDNSNNAFTVCPIARTPFVEGTTVTRINSCGHIFNNNEILRWFSRHNTCPVCRYNLNENNTPTTTIGYTSNSSSTGTQTTSTSTSTSTNDLDNSNNIIQNLTRNLTNLFQNELSNDVSGNLVAAEFEFNLPINIPFTPPTNNITPFSEDEDDN